MGDERGQDGHRGRRDGRGITVRRPGLRHGDGTVDSVTKEPTRRGRGTGTRTPQEWRSLRPLFPGHEDGERFCSKSGVDCEWRSKVGRVPVGVDGRRRRDGGRVGWRRVRRGGERRDSGSGPGQRNRSERVLRLGCLHGQRVESRSQWRWEA